MFALISRLMRLCLDIEPLVTAYWFGSWFQCYLSTYLSTYPYILMRNKPYHTYVLTFRISAQSHLIVMIHHISSFPETEKLSPILAYRKQEHTADHVCMMRWWTCTHWASFLSLAYAISLGDIGRLRTEPLWGGRPCWRAEPVRGDSSTKLVSGKMSVGLEYPIAALFCPPVR